MEIVQPYLIWLVKMVEKINLLGYVSMKLKHKKLQRIYILSNSPYGSRNMDRNLCFENGLYPRGRVSSSSFKRQTLLVIMVLITFEGISPLLPL